MAESNSGDTPSPNAEARATEWLRHQRLDYLWLCLLLLPWYLVDFVPVATSPDETSLLYGAYSLMHGTLPIYRPADPLTGQNNLMVVAAEDGTFTIMYPLGWPLVMAALGLV